jgi:tripartite-type tricarboxylate transporter receptor subunit TctC
MNESQNREAKAGEFILHPSSLILSLLCAALVACMTPVAAQTYPVKPVRMVVPFPAGGPTDIVGRTIGQKLNEALGQSIIIDNRAGAGGVIGTEYVAKSPPDGYTILLGSISGLAVAMSLYPNRGYDSLRDFAPVTQAVTVTNILVVHPALPVKSVRDLLALARAKPGALNYASSGSGTVTHLAGELFKTLGRVNIVHVPFKGGAPALTALMSGEVQMSYENSLIVVPHIKAGKLHALAVTGLQRSKLMPELPTIAEGGLPGYAASGWYGFVVPAAVPKEIVARLNADVARILRMPDVVERLSGQGAEPVGGTAEQFAAFIRSEIDKWSGLVKATNMKPD